MNQTHAHQFILDKARATAPQLAFSEDAAWRQTAREKLTELLGLPLASCDDAFALLGTQEYTDHRRISFAFQSEPGYTVCGEFVVPHGATGKLPVVIGLQGHTTGRHITLGEQRYEGDDARLSAGCQDFAVQALAHGFCAVAIDQRYMGEAGHNDAGLPGCCTTGHALPTLLLGRTPIGERVWDVMRLIDVLLTHFAEYIDADNILCIGNSGGGTAAFYAACLDDRISLAVPSCGVCTYEDSIIAIHHCSCNYVPDIRRYFNMGDLGCLIAPRDLVVVCGIKDDIFPVAGVEETFHTICQGYRAVGRADRCRLVKGDGGHRFYPDDAWPVILELMGRA
ncbi:MAG: acetylxylan esterase [Clostridia bacterium]|nr:acetylxylan esterase [Clostridia bacterium]